MSRLRRTYEGPTKIYFVTTNTHYRRKLFLDDGLAKVVVNTLLFIQKKRWIDMIAYVVMPDGLHVMFEITGGKNVSEVVHSLKSYAAQRINKLRQGRDAMLRQGRDALAMGENKLIGGASQPRRYMKKVWQDSFYDRVVDNWSYLNHLINYIHYNPVKDGLVDKPEDWKWSSVHIYKKKGYY